MHWSKRSWNWFWEKFHTIAKPAPFSMPENKDKEGCRTPQKTVTLGSDHQPEDFMFLAIHLPFSGPFYMGPTYLSKQHWKAIAKQPKVCWPELSSSSCSTENGALKRQLGIQFSFLVITRLILLAISSLSCDIQNGILCKNVILHSNGINSDTWIGHVLLFCWQKSCIYFNFMKTSGMMLLYSKTRLLAADALEQCPEQSREKRKCSSHSSNMSPRVFLSSWIDSWISLNLGFKLCSTSENYIPKHSFKMQGHLTIQTLTQLPS